ncbi:MAG: sigma-70 family RNA polymerase sigma factor [Veillonellales bacterium]
MFDHGYEFEQVYEEFQPKIHRYLTRMIGPKEAEDLTQEVFIKVGKALNTYRKESQMSTWIYRIATNAAIDRMRNPSYRRELVGKQPNSCLNKVNHTEDAGNGAGVSCQPCSMEEQVVHKEMNDCIRGVIENLPDNYRVVVILSELEGLKNKEIAEILEISLDMVKVRLHRGKARLKKELLNYCQFSWDERNEFICDPKVPVKNKK